MSSKIAADHLARSAIVCVRQSTMGQVLGKAEGRRRQYADTARAAGFSSVAVIDDDLGRSGSGLAERPGFQKLVTAVCVGSVGAVYRIEASRLVRNGRDWHHLVDPCALAATLMVDPDGAYDPHLVNPRSGRRGSVCDTGRPCASLCAFVSFRCKSVVEFIGASKNYESGGQEFESLRARQTSS